MGNTRPTIKDVAARAGVHPGTASRALNPRLPGRISPATTAKVVAAAQELGYRPDPAAQSLRTRRSGFVGVVVPDLTNPVIPPIVRGIEAVMWEAGYACLLADTANDPGREEDLVAEFVARRCDGLVIASATRSSQAVASLGDKGIPTVLVTRDIDDGAFPLVAGDDAVGVDAAVRHLAELGHRHIAYITGPVQLTTTVRREAAFRSAAGTLLSDDDPIVHRGPAFSIEAGRVAATELLAEGCEVTAILAGNDMIAVGVYEALATTDLRCPDDISVVGHNDMPLMAQLHPPLTTVAIPQAELGAVAARTLLAMWGGATPEQRQLLTVELVIRGSTAPPPDRPSSAAT